MLKNFSREIRAATLRLKELSEREWEKHKGKNDEHAPSVPQPYTYRQAHRKVRTLLDQHSELKARYD
jgi:hypothetical protein